MNQKSPQMTGVARALYPALNQKSPTIYQKSPTFNHNSPADPALNQKSPTIYQKSPTFSQKSPAVKRAHQEPHLKSPAIYQKSPTSDQKSPTFYQKSPLQSNEPSYIIKRALYTISKEPYIQYQKSPLTTRSQEPYGVATMSRLL